MKNMGWVVRLCVLLSLAGLAHGVVGTKKGLNSDQIQLKEPLTGTITRIDRGRIRVVEDDDQSGCAAGIRLVDVVDGTKLFRGGTGITEQDLRRGDRVAIEATVRGEVLEATEIRVNELSSPEHAH
jgi:hypothetical protein